MTFVGLDPDLLRLEARRFLEVAEESRLLAAEYREIGRVGLMEEHFEPLGRQLDEVEFEMSEAAKLMLRKCDEMEALIAPGGILSMGLGRLPTSTVNPLATSYSFASGPTSTRFGGTLRFSGTGPGSGRTEGPQPQPPLTETPNITMPRAGNWAGFDAKSIAISDEVVAKLLKREGYPTDLSDDDLRAVAVWTWRRQHDLDAKGVGEVNDVNDVFNKLSPHDQARLYAVTSVFDTRAYNAVKALKSAKTEELIGWLASPAAKKLTIEQQAEYAKNHFGISDPEVMDATITYIGYQLRAAYMVDHPFIRPEFLVIHGWASPVIDVQPWARAAVTGTIAQGSMVGPMHLTQAIGDLFHGRVPKYVQQMPGFDNVTRQGDGSWSIDGKTVAILVVGIAAAALFTWATGGLGLTAFAMIEASLATVVGDAAASVLAFMIVGAGIGAGSEVAAGVATRFSEWMMGDRPFDEVFDPHMVAHDALIGGLFGIAGGLISSQVQRLFSASAKAARNVKRIEKALEKVQRSRPGSTSEILILKNQLKTAVKDAAEAKRAHELALAAQRRIVAEVRRSREAGAARPFSWVRMFTGEVDNLTIAARIKIDRQIQAKLAALKMDPTAFDAIVAAGKVPAAYIDDARVAFRELMKSNVDDAGLQKLLHNLTTCQAQKFHTYVAEMNAALADIHEGVKQGSRIVLSHASANGKANLLTDVVDTSPIDDVDVLSVSADGVTRVTEVKANMSALMDVIVDHNNLDTNQLVNLQTWQSVPGQTRQVVLHVDTTEDWTLLFRYLRRGKPATITDLAKLGFDLRLGDQLISAKKISELLVAFEASGLKDWQIVQNYSSIEELANALGVTL